MNKKSTGIPEYTWLLSAMTAPLAVMAVESDWGSNLLIGLLCTGISIAVLKNVKTECWPRWMWLVQSLWLTIMLAALLPETAGMWPEGNTVYFVPLTLLALAAWSAQGELSRGISAGAVLIWFVGGLMAGIAAAGVKDVRLQWLVPEEVEVNPAVVTVYFLPLVLMFLGKGEGKGWRLLVFPLMGGALSALVWGILSRSGAELGNGFYSMSKSLSLFGKTRRFEAVAASAVTLGWYAIISLLVNCLCRTAKHLGKPGNDGLVSAGILGAAICVLCDITISRSVLLGGILIFWVFLPILTQFVGPQKKMEKNEKSP